MSGRLSYAVQLVRRLLATWRRDDGGAAAVVFALALVPLLIGAGVVVDGGAAYLVRDRLAKALDSAGLAAARVSLSASAEADARRYFDANFRDGYIGAEVTDFSVVFSEDRELVTLSAEAAMPTSLMRIAGIDSVTVRQNAVIQRMNRGLEVALVMDNTGSMRGSGCDKMCQMKAAATDLVNVLFGDRETMTNLWVSLVPYSAMVNVGAGRTGWLAAGDTVFDSPSPFRPTAWKGCVKARGSGGDETDTPPALSPFGSFYWGPSSDNVWSIGDASTVRDENSAQNNGTGPNLGCGPAITSLTNRRQTLIDAIDEMLPWHRGGTTSNLGMVWGWRTISPQWRGLWGGPTPVDYPLDYEEELMDKAVVLLTDGDNQFYDHPPTGPYGSDMTAYGRLNDLGFTKLDAGKTELDARLARMCLAMKSREIQIYTITFGGTPNTATQTLYRNCATEPGDYFHAPDAATLNAAFNSIGQRLSNLRVVR